MGGGEPEAAEMREEGLRGNSGKGVVDFDGEGEIALLGVFEPDGEGEDENGFGGVSVDMVDV